MTECQIHGCLYLRTHCAICGRVVDVKSLPKAQEWISVKDRHPEMAGHYLVCDDFLGITEKVEFDGKSQWDWMMNVSHWMPLPEPPK